MFDWIKDDEEVQRCCGYAVYQIESDEWVAENPLGANVVLHTERSAKDVCEVGIRFTAQNARSQHQFELSLRHRTDGLVHI